MFAEDHNKMPIPTKSHTANLLLLKTIAKKFPSKYLVTRRKKKKKTSKRREEKREEIVVCKVNTKRGRKKERRKRRRKGIDFHIRKINKRIFRWKFL